MGVWEGLRGTAPLPPGPDEPGPAPQRPPAGGRREAGGEGKGRGGEGAPPFLSFQRGVGGSRPALQHLVLPPCHPNMVLLAA